MKLIKRNEKIYIEYFEHDKTSVHSHEFLELVYVVEGSALQTVNDKKILLSKGDYFFIDYGTRHGYSKTNKGIFKIINCIFLPEFIDGTLLGCHSFQTVLNNYLIKFNKNTLVINPADFVFKDLTGEIYILMQKMIEEFKMKKTGYIEIMRGELINLIIYTLREYVDRNKIAENDICSTIIKEINNSYSEKISLNWFADRFNYSLPYLSRKFKETIGISFREYLQNTRIEQSCRLLVNTNKKIIDIAQSVGYDDVNFFTDIFKKKMNITPREFRKTKKENLQSL